MHIGGVTVRRFRTATALARALARDVASALAARPALVVGLPTGRTPVPLYGELVRLYEAGLIDFSRATTFNLDEFLIASEDPHSYRSFMQRHLFGRVNIDPRRIHFLKGLSEDSVAECRRYEREITRSGGIDLMILGVGRNGHIGFNEPSAGLEATTHKARLRPATRQANAGLFEGRAQRVPGHALSMGMATILRARRIVLIATGRSKASAVRRLVTGRITPRVPASFMQLHPNAEVWVDEPASSGLSARAR